LPAPYAIVGGTPARLIRYRFNDEARAALDRLRWWELTDDLVRALPMSDVGACLDMIGELRDRHGVQPVVYRTW
jgi:hypothetical protein